MSILLKEIYQKKNELIEISSQKEKYFYSFLKGEKNKYIKQKWDLDDFVVSIFSNNPTTSPPQKNWDDVSFIDLFAIAKYEKSYTRIKNFTNNKSIKYDYLINCFLLTNKSNKDLLLREKELPIDILVKEIINKEIKIESIIQAVENVEDLIDIYIVEKSFEILCKKDLELISQGTIKKRNRRYSLFFWVLLIVFVYIICITSNTLFMKNLSDILVQAINQLYGLILKINKRITWLWIIWLLWIIIRYFPKALWFIFKKDYTWKKRWQQIRDLF